MIYDIMPELIIFAKVIIIPRYKSSHKPRFLATDNEQLTYLKV